MTRLTKAIERARAGGLHPAIPIPPNTPQALQVEVPKAWNLPTQPETDNQGAVSPAAAPLRRVAPVPPTSTEERSSTRIESQYSAATQPVFVGAELPLVVEQYRRLAARLHQRQQQAGVRVVVVASAVAGEGKTLTANNLAFTLSESYKKRVLLIDADLRQPSLHRWFGVSAQPGLTTVLESHDSVSLPLRQISEHLTLLTGGPRNSDPMGVLTSSRMREVIVAAAAQSDWVVIDTPPVAVMPDAHLLADMIDVALLVVQAGRTPYPLVKRALEAFSADRVLGVVLNRSNTVALDGYGYYDGRYDLPDAAGGTAEASKPTWRRLVPR